MIADDSILLHPRRRRLFPVDSTRQSNEGTTCEKPQSNLYPACEIRQLRDDGDALSTGKTEDFFPVLFTGLLCLASKSRARLVLWPR
jgi:hypothetical protein